jgi:hypothetical protein
VYTSADDGRTWRSTLGPGLGGDDCQRGDPSAAVDASGRQYVAFTVSRGCVQDDQTPYVVVAARTSTDGAWTVRRLGAKRPADFWDDYPSLAVARDGRVYAVWSRLLRWTHEGIVVSSSVDGGRTWTAPRPVDPQLSYPRLASATVGPDGTLYVAGVDARFGVWVAQSHDHGRHFELARAARLPANRAASCATASRHPTPFQGVRCVGPNPSVVASTDRVFVTYAVGWPGEAQTVRVAALDRKLRPVWRGEVAPVKARADRFWPAAAFDATTRRLWVCFYDTSGDPSRKQAWFSCSTSRDGRTWTRPRRAARDSSSPEVLWEDARVYAFGDVVGYGGYTAVTAARGVAHPLWIDTRNVGGRKQEIFGATMR